jgi:hypothetical protein
MSSDELHQQLRDGALLAHISDTVTAFAEGLEEHRQVQQNILTMLDALLETNQAQSEMLAEILGAASQEAGPSPVAQAREALVAVIERLDQNQTTLIARITELPEAIGGQIVASLQTMPAAAATPS